MSDLFSYPHTAGVKATGTSQEAAETIDATGLRREVLDALTDHGPMTADECSAVLGRDRLSIRPRFSELRAMGLVCKTDLRRRNASGLGASVWRAS